MANSFPIDKPAIGFGQPNPQQSLLTLLSIAVYDAYSLSLQGTRASGEHYEWMKDVVPGDLVMEVSTIHYPHRNAHRFGYLLGIEDVPFYTDEQWEELKEDSEVRPMDRGYRLQLLTDGSEYVWTNCSFVRVPVSTIDGAKVRHHRHQPKVA